VINFKSIPFFKIILPYVIGIIFYINTAIISNSHLFFLAIIILWSGSFLIQTFFKSKGYFKKWTYIVLSNLLLFTLAYEGCFLYQAKNSSNHYSNYVSTQPQSFIATITDLPIVNKKFVKLTVQIQCIEKNAMWNYAKGETILYLKNDSTLIPKLGNNIFVTSKFSVVNESKNPFEFDYKQFLQNKNIYHTVYVNDLNCHIVPFKNASFNFTQLGTQIKASTVSVLRSSGLSHSAFSICSALLVGYDDEIESDTMKSFSHSGTLHILSVSGMHTGVLYAILVFLFSVIDKHDRYKKVKFGVILSFLVLFIFITGLSPSVLRAALMLALVLLGKTFYRQGNSYNTLLLSAFVLLVFNPFLIIDVGFLLSYFAVFGIMYFYPILSKLYVFENKILQWLWASVLISIAATVFTLPITLYYFHQFPIWFALSNLIIIPISMMILVGAVLLILCFKLIAISQLLVYCINGCTNMMLWFAKLSDNKTYGYIDFISFSKIDIVFLSITIFLVFVIIANKRYKQVVYLCYCIIAWLSYSIYDNYLQRQQNELIVFYVKQKAAFALRLGQVVYADTNELDTKEFERSLKPYLLTISHLKLNQMEGDIVNYKSVSILHATNSTVYNHQLKPNYIIVSHNTSINLTTNYKTKPIVIADCSNTTNFVKLLKQQCRELDIVFYDVKENGAVQIKL
jgi:competence protein ComEC